ncbi:branched-chain amino acid ABC transporter permease [Pseudomonas sp. TH41]|uniref:branched-chain amino acid ABC transporter permease n=1 Tax=Pseudomonas sp. TH41 TaxID=2796405 RepID=UPI001912B772|nr:branched-chain amino acid ABC transporter permease [Pseudomonas sp. TH41]MBK5355954.1 branched-chain amino acid ABC transporter permease [Pseudomonas sp. TH41]
MTLYDPDLPMNLEILSQYLINGLMLGMIYAMVAVGFTLFFGVLDVIKFSHGDVLMVGGFAGLSAFTAAQSFGIANPWLQLLIMLVAALAVTAALGALVARFLILPLRDAPPINLLLITLMLGLVLRECIRLFYPDGSNSKPFPQLLPSDTWHLGNLAVRADSAILLLAGALTIVGVHQLINRSKLGLAIRAVAQDGETARVMGINFERIVLVTFALGSALAAMAGMMNGLYYNEINFNVGLLLGVIGFCAAILGGLGNFYGAILGGFLFAALQTFGAVALPHFIPGFQGAYKDVFAFLVVIVLLAWKPTGLIAERSSERV